MIANRSTNTGPEQVVRRMLREGGHPGYRLHWRIDDENGRYVCRPDITYPGREIAIFVHGCFWHRCPRCALELPKTNKEYWSEKFERNVERDRRKEQMLLGMGWEVHTIWECDLDQGASKLIGIM
jgi:DNA mismatch endonuclease (patch repair protein)|tara:strand:+ start:25896 stop:26270 length:375 start_codon:yes stop_codon:yes gene_type:complete